MGRKYKITSNKLAMANHMTSPEALQCRRFKGVKMFGGAADSAAGVLVSTTWCLRFAGIQCPRFEGVDEAFGVPETDNGWGD